MITKNEKYKEYIADIPSYSFSEQTFYRFPNKWGASVIFGPSTYGLEVGVIRWNGDDWDLDYSTPLTSDVIGHVEDLDSVLESIRQLPERVENVSKNFDRFQEPELDRFELEAWNSGEIYKGEEYLHMQHNGDIVLLEKDTIMEYLSDHYEFTLELLDNVAIRKVAGE